MCLNFCTAKSNAPGLEGKCVVENDKEKKKCYGISLKRAGQDRTARGLLFGEPNPQGHVMVDPFFFFVNL
jgi:hypothetical protein